MADGFGILFDRLNMTSLGLTIHQEICQVIAARGRLLLAVGLRAIRSAFLDRPCVTTNSYYDANMSTTTTLGRVLDPIASPRAEL